MNIYLSLTYQQNKNKKIKIKFLILFIREAHKKPSILHQVNPKSLINPK
jgi:hypothetical protein